MAENHLKSGRRSAKRDANRARSLSRVEPNLRRNRSDQSSSRSTDISENKILNFDPKENESGMFLEVCDTFERILKELNLSESSQRVQDKLTKIGLLIENKISLAKKSNRDSLTHLLKWTSLSVNDLSQSRRSLRSESSYESDLESGSGYDKFMKEVNCPFCSEVQSDKVGFVKHLDRSCSAHFKKEFKKDAHFPYAEFQILPNNLIKCNICPNNQVQQDLRHFYDHSQSQAHRRFYANAAKVKNYVNRLFCACCKALVYNNYTQIKGHIDQEAHKSKCELKKTTADFLQSGIHFVYTESCKFKCLDCPPGSAVCNTPKSALGHLDNANHKKHKKKNIFYLSAIYCEVCSKEVQLYEIITHFSSNFHCANESKLKEESFELCFCCNFFCKSLLELSQHMESKCVEIKNLRRKIPKESQPAEEGNKSKGPSKTVKNLEEEGNINKGPSITVKNFTKIPALFKYFTQFGEIVTIESHNDKDVVIEFRERKAVDDVLLLQNVIVMDGTKLEIATDLKVNGSVEKPEPETEPESEDSDESSKNKSSADLGNGDAPIQDGRLDELFAKVSSYLMNTAQKLNSYEKLIIQQDCVRTLGFEICHLVGFSGSGLSFPSETLNLFCGVSGSIPIVNDLLPLTKNLLKAAHIKLSDSELWQKVECRLTHRPYPCLECVHKDTEKACRIFLNETVLVLTDMLRECMEKSELVKPLCLMIRFWLCVNELKIKDSEFSLISLLVFFLINVNVVTLSEEKYSKSLFFNLISEKGEVFPAPPWNLKLLVSVKELFQKFLQFIDSFDFEKYAICLPSRCPVPKSVFNEQLFKELPGLKGTDSPKSCDMHILDPLSFTNLAADIDRQHIKEFLEVVNATVKHYKIK